MYMSDGPQTDGPQTAGPPQTGVFVRISPGIA